MRFAPMFRSFNMFMLILLIAIVTWTFKVKHDSREAHLRIVALEKQIKAQEVEIDLFKSDWSLLTSPKRLETLIERYGEQLGLERARAFQLTDENSLPPLKSELPPEPSIEGEDFANAVTGNVQGGTQ